MSIPTCARTLAMHARMHAFCSNDDRYRAMRPDYPAAGEIQVVNIGADWIILGTNRRDRLTDRPLQYYYTVYDHSIPFMC